MGANITTALVFNNDIEETYINKKLSDCLVGVFGVDSEKDKLFDHLGIEEKSNLGMIGPSSRRRRGSGRGSASGREWRSGEATGGSGAAPG